MKNRIDSSRRKTPWDDNVAELSPSRQFVGAVYRNHYYEKHKTLLESKEYEFVNSIELEQCRHCGSSKIVKRGFTSNKVQRYFCNSCNRSFTIYTGTIFNEHKLPITEWIEFLLNLINYDSLTQNSKSNKNAINTTIFWLHKLFILLDNYQDDIVLEGKVYIDEMFYSVLKGDLEFQNGKQLRGLSKNKLCIGVGYDTKSILAIYEKKGKPSTEATNKAFIKHIKEGSILIHDGEKAHNDLVKKLNLKSKSYNSKELKSKSDKDNPLRPINHVIDLIRQFLNAHSGFDRNYIQDYLNLFCYFYSRKELKPLEKVDELLNLALTTKIEFKNYRTLFHG